MLPVIIITALWKLICTVYKVSQFIFPRPLRIATPTWQYKDDILGHAWRTCWVTMASFGNAMSWACGWALWSAHPAWPAQRYTRC